MDTQGQGNSGKRALTGVPSPPFLPYSILRSVPKTEKPHPIPTSTVSTFRFQRGTCAQRTKTRTQTLANTQQWYPAPHPPRVLLVQRRRVALQSANSVETPSKLIGFVNQIRYELAGPRSLLGRNTSSSCSPDPGRPSGPNPLPCRPAPLPAGHATRPWTPGRAPCPRMGVRGTGRGADQARRRFSRLLAAAPSSELGSVQSSEHF